MAYKAITGISSNNSNHKSNQANNNQNPSINLSGIGGVPSDSDNEALDLLIDYAKLAQEHKLHKVQFRNDATEAILTSMNLKNHPNVLLTGEAGTGKTAIVEDLAVRIQNQEPTVIDMIGKQTKIYELPLTNLVSGSGVFGAMEKKLKNVMEFIEDPKNHAILYIDEIHQLFKNQSLKSVSDTLKPALSRGNIHVIASTTIQEAKFLKKDPAFLRRFSKITIPELTNQQTLEILKQVLPILQASNQRKNIDLESPELFKTIVKTANQYATAMTTHRPDSAITILDQALSIVKLQYIKTKQAKVQMTPIITKKTITKAADYAINIKHEPQTQTVVNTLKTRLKQNIIGQPDAKQNLIDAMSSIILNLLPNQKPHSFLFCGPTGTGKTEIVKQLSQSLYGTANRIIRLNMTEFANQGSLNRIIGSATGYVGSEDAKKMPLDNLQTNPFQIVLLDEFEKADKNVQRLFMQALDEGSLEYNDGTIIDFSHAIVVATTNANSKLQKPKHVGFNQVETNKSQTQIDVTKALSKTFPKELINRFEYVTEFDSINQTEYAEILALKYNKITTEIKKHKPQYQFVPKTATKNDAFIQKIVKSSYDPTKNGRPAERTIRHLIETKVLTNLNQVTFDFN